MMSLQPNNIIYESESIVKEILKPLTRCSDIHYFCYGVNYPDTRGFTLNSNAKYYESWFFYEIPLCGFYLPNGWTCWKNTFTKKQKEVADELNIGDGYYFVKKNENFTEIFAYGTTSENTAEVYDFFMNNQVLLRKFNMYFIENAKGLIAKAKMNLVKPLKKMVVTPEMRVSMQHDTVASNQFFTENTRPFSFFSDREAACFRMILKGFSNEEISNSLKLSVKTVESYISRIKSKLQLSSTNRNKIIQWAHEMGYVDTSMIDC
ncbi:LuxR C-terminal-related transcriptional regulator [Candidatus Berkiella aquae]|uniref:Helix-turn-helix transcriptional regulator n=1 Tax=Candidatus Berkiella aquae TaxID=295108 RepID=A0A0Q9YSW9_9GAMM|nr:helix-turn-helix transcriptional regulator [Candidatus Berkiella aquae]MCS5711294.1 helix-turn-helix transcriptional regulator [Candidatus Berkiella aquae]